MTQRGNTIGSIRSNERIHRKWIDILHKLWQSKSKRHGCVTFYQSINHLNNIIIIIIITKNIDFSNLQESNQNVAATFYWLPLRRQVRLEGVVSKISQEESEFYFHQRPRASQVCVIQKKKMQIF